MFDARRTVHAILDYMAKWLPEEPAALKRLDDIADLDDDIDAVDEGSTSSVPMSGVQVTASADHSRTRAAS
jgi:hypothetical protein